MNGATENLGFFGGNPHPNPAHPILLDDAVLPANAANQQNDQIMPDEDNAAMDLDPWEQAAQGQIHDQN